MMVFLTHPPLLPAETCALRPPCGEAAMGRGSSPSAEKILKPSNSVKLSQVEDPSERHNSLGPCGKTGLNPCPPPMPPKARFWAIKPMRWRGAAQFAQFFDRFLTIQGRGNWAVGWVLPSGTLSTGGKKNTEMGVLIERKAVMRSQSYRPLPGMEEGGSRDGKEAL